jgi:tetratricopeptide (TPR) repeat protein
MATQVKTENESAPRRGQSGRQENGSDGGSRPDSWKEFVDTLSHQFGEAIDPVLAELPQRMAKAIESTLTKDGERVAQIVPERPEDSGASRGNPQAERTDAGTPRRGDGSNGGPSSENQRGGEDMASASRSTDSRETQKRSDDNRSEARGTDVERRTKEQNRQDNQGREVMRRRSSGRTNYHYDAIAATRAGLIRLASSWSEAGAPFQAIRIYTQVLDRYPNSGAAVAAAEELLALAERLQEQGMYFTAAGILDKLYQYS